MKYPNLLAARAFLYIGLGYLWCSKEVVGCFQTLLLDHPELPLQVLESLGHWWIHAAHVNPMLHVEEEFFKLSKQNNRDSFNSQASIIFQQNLVASIWVQELLWWRTSFVFFIGQAHSTRRPQARNPRIRLRIQADGESRCLWWNLMIRAQSTTHCAKILFASILRNRFAFPHAKLEPKTDRKKNKKKTPHYRVSSFASSRRRPT